MRRGSFFSLIMPTTKIRALKLLVLCMGIGSIIVYFRTGNSVSTQVTPVVPYTTVVQHVDHEKIIALQMSSSSPVATTRDYDRIQKEIQFPPVDFPEVLVHLDLKGAPPKLKFYDAVFPLLRKLGATGLLIEYEDMFPYYGVLNSLSAKNAYNKSEISQLLAVAHANKLKVIPLVQTFGHLEFALKLGEFAELRELSDSPQALCPSLNSSLALVRAMLDQVLSLHPSIEYLHIGCDEVFSLGQCPRCEHRLQTTGMTRESLFLAHVEGVIKHVVQAGVRPIMWDDMLRNVDLDQVRQWNMSHLVDLMVWAYTPNISKHIMGDIWEKYSQFKGVWVASAFKGATGPKKLLPDIWYHLRNHQSWLKELQSHKGVWHLRGIALTGWQRYDHFASLCELLPASIPSLAANLLYVQYGRLDESQMSAMKDMLGCNRPIAVFDPTDSHLLFCRFHGAKVLTGIQQLLSLLKKKEVMEKNSHYVGWLGSYNVRQAFVSPDHILDATRNLSEILGTANHLQRYLSDALTEVYDSYTVKEWMGTFLDPIVAQLTLLEQQTQQLLAHNTWPRRPVEGNA